MERLTRKIEKSSWRDRGRKPSGYTSDYTKQEVDGHLALYENLCFDKDGKEIIKPEKLAALVQAESEGRVVEFASIAEKEERLDGYKFYYCASEDSYLLGYRVDNFYHARWHEPLGFVWEMSKYLPWGETISDESTDWKTHTYPSKPTEMGVNEWFNGFLNQRIKAALAAKEERE